METKMAKGRRYTAEFRERAVRMVREAEASHESEWAAICSVSEKLGCSTEGLRKRMRRAEVDAG